MAVCELIQLILKLFFYETRSYKLIKIIQITFLLSRTFFVQLNTINTEFYCWSLNSDSALQMMHILQVPPHYVYLLYVI